METNSLFEEAIVGKQDGKHLVFLLGGASYGIPILTVLDINGLMEITPIPKTPEFIKGVINLRGKVIPVMDLRLKFGMPAAGSWP
jgi:purine-binding chemotaxis protein CheW